MINYDANMIYKFAEKLYKKANLVIASYTLLGLILGIVGGMFFGNANGGGETTIKVVAIIAALIGFEVGRGKAFLLKLQAQTALCQVKIEQNTSGKIV